MITRATIALLASGIAPIALFSALSACFANGPADAPHPLPDFDAQAPEQMPSAQATSRRVVTSATKDAVASSAPRTNAEITADIKASIAKNSELGGEKIDVSVEGGVVTLKGVVRDMDTRDSVENIVRHTPGVTKLDDRLIATDPHPRTMDPGPTGY